MSTPPSRLERWITAAEVALVALLLAGHIWLVWEWLPLDKTGQRVVRITMIALLVSVLVGSFGRGRDSRESLGLTLANMKSGWWPIAGFTIVSLAALVAVAAAFYRETLADLNPEWLLTYSHGMLGQQLALQWFLNNRVYRALGGDLEGGLGPWALGPGASHRHQGPRPKAQGLTIIICVIIFTLLHAPNPGLMLSVLPASAFWCWHFRRYRNMPALLVSHFILGGAAMMLLGDGPLLRLRVGPPAWRLLMGE